MPCNAPAIHFHMKIVRIPEIWEGTWVNATLNATVFELVLIADKDI